MAAMSMDAEDSDEIELLTGDLRSRKETTFKDTVDSIVYSV